MESLLNHVITHTAFRLLLAALLGGIIGLERELRGKPAGLRTNILIAMGRQVIRAQRAILSKPVIPKHFFANLLIFSSIRH